MDKKESSSSSELDLAVRQAIQDIAVGPDRGRDISADLAKEVMDGILHGQVDEVQAGIFLIALRMKRESQQEFAGLMQSLSNSIASRSVAIENLICLADPFDGYLRNASMTPFIPPVLAALDCPAYLHGIEEIGPKFGVTAAKVYKLAGMDIAQTSDAAASQLENIGWTYIDQSVYASRLSALESLRNRMIKRTALTTLERLLMPLRAKRNSMALGYVHKAYPEIYAQAALQSGFDDILLFKGVEGGLAPALNKPLRRYYFSGKIPENPNDNREVIEIHLDGESSSAAVPMPANRDAVAAVLERGRDVLRGKPGLARDSLVLAAANIVSGLERVQGFDSAVEKVQRCLDNGSALSRFEALLG